MKIKTKLRFNWLIIAVNTLILLSIILFPIRNQYVDNDQKAAFIDSFSEGTIKLAMLSHEYLLHYSERAAGQWKILSQDLFVRIDNIEKLSLSKKERLQIHHMSRDLIRIKEYFTDIGKTVRADETDKNLILKRLESFLIQYAQHLTEDTIEFQKLVAASHHKIMMQSFIIILASLLATLAGTFILSFWLNKNIINSISRLQAGVRKIEQGDLSYNVQTFSDDEIGMLGKSFNRMTESLKKTRDELKDRLNFMNTLMETIPNPLFYKDKNGIHLGCNRAFEQFYGKTKEQIVGRSVFEMASREIAAECDRKDNELLKTGNSQSFEWKAVNSKNETRDVFLNKAVFKDMHGEIAGSIGVLLDITERKKIEVQVHELLTLNRQVINESPIGISAYDPTGNCILANEAMARIVGGTPSKLLEQNYHQIDSWKNTGLYDMANQVIACGDMIEKKFHIRTTFGKKVWLFGRMARFSIKDNFHLLLMVEDITEKAMFENMIKEKNEVLKQSNQQLEDFAYIASHDLQEPLRKIMSFGDLLHEEENDNLSEDGKDYLNRMQKSAARLRQFIEDLLAYSRVNSKAKQPTEIDLNTIFNDILFDLERQIQESSAQIKAENLPMIEAEPLHMHQLFQNLIGNSIKYRSADCPPQIVITARPVEPRMVEISFKDNGIGFEERYLDRIFKPFQRLHGRGAYSGTGIGLAICQKIVLHHGGDITAKSQPGQGSTFIVTLPEKQLKKEDTDGKNS